MNTYFYLPNCVKWYFISKFFGDLRYSEYSMLWMNKWTYVFFIYCTYRIMSYGGLQCYWVRSNVSLWRHLWLPLFWSHSPTQPIHETRDRTSRDRTSSPTLSDKCVGYLTSPANHATLKMQETEPTVYSPYPRRLQCLIICRYNYKGSTFSSVILRPWVLGLEPSTSRAADWSSTNWANQAAV